MSVNEQHEFNLWTPASCHVTTDAIPFNLRPLSCQTSRVYCGPKGYRNNNTSDKNNAPPLVSLLQRIHFFYFANRQRTRIFIHYDLLHACWSLLFVLHVQLFDFSNKLRISFHFKGTLCTSVDRYNLFYAPCFYYTFCNVANSVFLYNLC